MKKINENKPVAYEPITWQTAPKRSPWLKIAAITALCVFLMAGSLLAIWQLERDRPMYADQPTPNNSHLLELDQISSLLHLAYFNALGGTRADISMSYEDGFFKEAEELPDLHIYWDQNPEDSKDVIIYYAQIGNDSDERCTVIGGPIETVTTCHKGITFGEFENDMQLTGQAISCEWSFCRHYQLGDWYISLINLDDQNAFQNDNAVINLIQIQYNPTPESVLVKILPTAQSGELTPELIGALHDYFNVESHYELRTLPSFNLLPEYGDALFAASFFASYTTDENGSMCIEADELRHYANSLFGDLIYPAIDGSMDFSSYFTYEDGKYIATGWDVHGMIFYQPIDFTRDGDAYTITFNGYTIGEEDLMETYDEQGNLIETERSKNMTEILSRTPTGSIYEINDTVRTMFQTGDTSGMEASEYLTVTFNINENGITPFRYHSCERTILDPPQTLFTENYTLQVPPNYISFSESAAQQDPDGTVISMHVMPETNMKAYISELMPYLNPKVEVNDTTIGVTYPAKKISGLSAGDGGEATGQIPMEDYYIQDGTNLIRITVVYWNTPPGEQPTSKEKGVVEKILASFQIN